jgi:putative transposase
MHLHGIRANGKRRYKFTTDSKHALPIAPNLLDRQFTLVEPDKAWGDAVTSFAAHGAGCFWRWQSTWSGAR